MKVETEKKIASVLSSIEGDLISNLNDDDALLFVEWVNKLLSDTVKDRKEKELIQQLKNCSKEDELKLRKKKKKYAHTNYPYDLKIGDIVHVNYGFGYCGELSDGHYGIILSVIQLNKYFVIPLTSEKPKFNEFCLENLGLPSSTTKSYCRFDQLCHVHYRRIEKIYEYKQLNVGEDSLKILFSKINKFLNFPVYKS